MGSPGIVYWILSRKFLAERASLTFSSWLLMISARGVVLLRVVGRVGPPLEGGGAAWPSLEGGRPGCDIVTRSIRCPYCLVGYLCTV